MYPDPQAEAVMRGVHCAHARFVWNLCVEQQSWWRPGRGKAPGPAERQRQLAEASAAEPWLAAGSSSVQQQALRDFDKAMAAFSEKTNPAGRPGFRSKHGTQGFVIRDTKVRRISRRWGAVFVPKCGWVRFRWTRPLPGKPGLARVTLDRAGRWHVSFPAPQPAVQREPSGTATGIDRGVRTALVTSDGQHYRAPWISDRDAARYLGLQRRLVRQHDVIVLEKLNTTGMTRRPAPKPDPQRAGAFLPNRARAKAGLNRGILASCWGTLGRRLAQKAAASGVVVIYVDPRFTSQQCHACGHTSTGNRESQAAFLCQSCGHADHADANAARNILARGLLLTTGEAVPAHAPGHGAPRPRKTAQAAAGTTRSPA
jgi:putative transposase